MATPIKRIEKEYLLSFLNYKNIPLKCFAGKKEYTFILKKLDKDQMVFESEDHLSAFRKGAKIELKFSMRSARTNMITFSVYVYAVANRCLITSIPDYLYKNLSRAYSRVQRTPGLNIVIQKDGFYYDLNYEKISVADSADFDDLVSQLNENDINAVINENLNWIQQKTDGYKLILFKDNVPSSIEKNIIEKNIIEENIIEENIIEEKAVGKLGKILFISMPDGGFVSEKKNSGSAFFTEQSLMEYLLSEGENPQSAYEKIANLLRQRAARSICSDCYIPVVFLSYIIGYIHIWVNEGKNPPLTLQSIEKFRQFARIIVFSLEQDHYFEGSKKQAPTFSPKLLDISASGFSFVLDLNKEKITYSADDHFSVEITISNRVIRCKASVVRCHFDKAHGYYGCTFDNMEIEDARFLFEAVYGKPFTDNDIQFVAGSV